ncbi:MAG: ABC transporter ATP-binding protein [Candidatus Latescibacterota bacterium]|nr:ABC transporter ATP-binding protein [Candidatus Latescibacterota bacterium]
MSVTARGLAKEFPGPPAVPALSPLDLHIDAGEAVSVVGPSGCGKSTLLRLIAGLEAPTMGELEIGDEPVSIERGRATANLSYVLQDPTLLPWRNVHDNASLPLQLAHWPGSVIAEQASAALDLVGLGSEGRLYPHQLSGGMRMRVSIARALSSRPGLLLMDEPFGALDEISRQALNGELQRLWREQGFTLVFVTHSVQEAVFLGQRVIVLSPRPARMVSEHKVEFAFPRAPELRTSNEFSQLMRQVSKNLHGGTVP